MNQDLKEKWIAALESGTYVQGRRKLCSFNAISQDTGYCCLGVLCDIMGAEWVPAAEAGVKTCQFGTTKGTLLSLFGQEQLGLSGGVQHRLAQLNDDGYSFKFIADYIRKNL